jgi:hypothetical protein
MLPSTQRWSLTEVPPPSDQPLTLGFALNPEFAFSVLDKGPGANLPEVRTCLSAYIFYFCIPVSIFLVILSILHSGPDAPTFPPALNMVCQYVITFRLFCCFVNF